MLSNSFLSPNRMVGLEAQPRLEESFKPAVQGKATPHARCRRAVVYASSSLLYLFPASLLSRETDSYL